MCGWQQPGAWCFAICPCVSAGAATMALPLRCSSPPSGAPPTLTPHCSMIAETVLSDPVDWNEAVLQKEPAAYAEWIRRQNTWGGAIELSILSQ